MSSAIVPVVSNGRATRASKIVQPRRDNNNVDPDPADPVVEVPAWKRELLLKRRTYNWMATLLTTTTTPSPFNKAANHDEITDPDDRRSPEVCINHASTGNSAIHAQLNNGGAVDTVQLTGGIHAELEPSCSAVDFISRTRTTMAADVKSSPTLDWCRNDDQMSPVTHSPTHSEWFVDDVDDDSLDCDNGELEYGPGIVNRLRSKFISMSLKIGTSNLVPVRRVASMEHLLDVRDDPVVPPSTMTKFAKSQIPVNGSSMAAVQRYASRSSRGRGRSSSVSPTISSDVIKRARSMEFLSGPIIHNGLRPTIVRSYSSNAKDDLLPLLSPPPPLTTLALVNENVIIIEQTKPFNHLHKGDVGGGKGPSLSTLRVAKDTGNVALQAENEFPKPDTVRTFKRIFEPNGIVETETHVEDPIVFKKPSLLPPKVTPPPKPPGLKPSPRPPILNGCADGGAKYGPRPSRIPSPRIVSKPKIESVPTTELGLIGDNPLSELSDHSAAESTIEDNSISSVDVETHKLITTATTVTNDSTALETADIQGAKRGVSVATEDLDYVLSHLKPVCACPITPVATSSDQATALATQDKPKVVSIQAKLDEKPVGHIRPFQNLEQHKNKVNDLMSEAELPVICGVEVEEINHSAKVASIEPLPPNLPVKKPGQHRSGPVTQTFNFVGKDVQPHIANTAAPFSVKRPALKNVDKVDGNSSRNKENFAGSHAEASNRHHGGNYIIAGTDVDASWRNYVDEEDEDDDDDDDGDVLLRGFSGNGESYLAVVFIGSNVIVGRSALLKNRNKKLKIAFDDTAVSTYEYPSEGSLLEDVVQQADDDHRVNGDFAGRAQTSTDVDGNNKGDDEDHHQSSSSEEIQSSRPATSLKSTPAIGSTGGLSSYTPMAVVGSGNSFELGMTPRIPQPPPQAAITKQTNDAVVEEDIFLKPASDEQNSAWSNADTVDLLF